jgi:23S rRNA (uracil1939-C5)-methyltransferase
LKTRLVKDFLKEHADLRRDLVAEAIGGETWAYRNAIRVVFVERGGEVILGFHAHGSARVLDIARCPVQHPANEAMLQAAKDAVSDLRLPIYDRTTGRGLVRGLVGVASFSTGQALLTLSTAARLPDASAMVHALLDRVPGLVGILSSVQPTPTPELLGPRVRLLWGRDHIEDLVAGFRLRVRPTTSMPTHPRAMNLLVDAVVRAADLRTGDTVFDLTAQTPVIAMALAQTAAAVTGVVAGRRQAADAWEVAAQNGVANVVFTTRDPARALASAAVRRRTDVVVVTAQGPGIDPAVIGAVAAVGVPRVVYVARSLATCAKDLRAWRQARYRAVRVQPVDLLPHTSHVHVVAALRRV